MSTENTPERIAALAAMEAQARRLGRAIGGGLPTGIGFVLWLFEFGEGGWATYLSNVERQSMIKSLEELLVKLRTPGEERPPIPGKQS